MSRRDGSATRNPRIPVADHRDRDDEQRVPVQAEMRRREHRVDVRAEAEERDVAEIQEPGVADDDVQAETEHHVQHRVEADADDVAVAREHRKQRGGDPERCVERRPRRPPDLALDPAEDARQLLVPLLVGRDPVVDADANARLALVGTPRDVGDFLSAVHQTFCTAARPRSPLGRMSMTPMRIANTIACWKTDDT